MTITSVVPHKKNKDMMTVYIDDKFAFSITSEDFYSLHLYSLCELTLDQYTHIKNTVVFCSAKSAGVKYLALKLRTVEETRSKLENLGYDDETINNVLDELTAMGYLNDALYTQKYIYDRCKLKPKSKKMLKLELKAKGIEDSVISEVLDTCEMDETAIAEGLVMKKFRKYDLNDVNVQRKAHTFLQHRGFNHDLICETLNKLSRPVE